ncbi:MAG: hydroxymethylbilane synthase [Pseudomonadota bacterium]
MSDTRTVRIGTRGSPLAMFQAEEVRDKLISRSGLAADAIEIVVIKVTGDQIQDKALREFGGKGLFTKEIEDALIDGRIDMAVHSMKDVPTQHQPGLGLAAILEREDPRDAFVSLKYTHLDEMPAGATLGTSSLRRQAQVKALRPDLEVVGFRGNVQTRMRKLGDGVADATFLAVAGLNRLGNEEMITAHLAVDQVLPAIAQGAIGIETRLDDTHTRDAVAPLHHDSSGRCVAAERAFLKRLDGSCHTPIAGHATLDGTQMTLTGEILLPDGSARHSLKHDGQVADDQAAATLGDATARALMERAGPDFLAKIAV